MNDPPQIVISLALALAAVFVKTDPPLDRLEAELIDVLTKAYRLGYGEGEMVGMKATYALVDEKLAKRN